MIVQRVPLAREALEKALEMREQCGFEFGTPVNVFDLCDYVKPKVRLLFVDYSMEGCYLRSDRPLIQVSALRPLARRVFNCAHELGHHVFGHGSTIDQSKKRADPTHTQIHRSFSLTRSPDSFLCRNWAYDVLFHYEAGGCLKHNRSNSTSSHVTLELAMTDIEQPYPVEI